MAVRAARKDKPARHHPTAQARRQAIRETATSAIRSRHKASAARRLSTVVDREVAVQVGNKCVDIRDPVREIIVVSSSAFIVMVHKSFPIYSISGLFFSQTIQVFLFIQSSTEKKFMKSVEVFSPHPLLSTTFLREPIE